MLLTKNKNFIVADKDIHCIKLVRLSKENKRRTYKCPYTRKLIHDDVINGKENMVAKGNASSCEPTEYLVKLYPEYPFGFKEGLIHTYNFSELEKFGDITGFALFECIIPKGTKYLSGINSLGRESYAAKEIRFIRKLKIKKKEPFVDPMDKRAFESLSDDDKFVVEFLMMFF